MMTTPDELRHAYLWDPAEPADPDVAAIERDVASLRFDAGSLPLSLPLRRRPPRRPRAGVWLTVAAALVALAGAAALYRWTWPANAAWPMTISSGADTRRTGLAVGRQLRLTPAETARVDVARIGSMEVRPGSAIVLRATRSNRHRLALSAGGIRVRAWAPPRSVLVQTPAGDIVDLGCIFAVDVDARGTARVTVETGWVQLENAFGEMLVPAGSSSTMSPGAAPHAPVFDDATAAFRRGATLAENALWTGPGTPVDLAFLAQARRRDVITLLMIAKEAPPAIARAVLARAATLDPPPGGVTVDAIAGGDTTQLWRWYEALDLPPPKSWWLNWRDALRR